MNIALIGYGKMGKAIEEIAISKGHFICLKITSSNKAELSKEKLNECDVAIEFTGPESAVKNITTCIEAGIPVISGSTGWLNDYNKIEELCERKKGTFLYASNFSIGVNIFFEINKLLARLMNEQENYVVSINEIHHIAKLDAPSGTAITLAEQIIDKMSRLKNWTKDIPRNGEMQITSERIDPAPGTHQVKYSSAIDDIEIIHTAHSRAGFAEGAVLASDFIIGKKGIFSMKDVLGL